MAHHTKDRGDEGVAWVTADLMSFGLGVFRPLSEHTPFDLIATSPDYQRLSRVSVKYRSEKGGALTLPLKSFWADRHGTHAVVHDRATYDAVAIYCPDTHECYYVLVEEIPSVQLTLRLTPTRNTMTCPRPFAREFRDPLRLFGLTSPPVEPGTQVGITAALPRARPPPPRVS